MRSRRWSAGSSRSQARTAPSVLALTRQNLPQLRTGYAAENRCAAGAYEIAAAAEGAAQVSLFAIGLRGRDRRRGAQRLLAERGIAARVVSVPCFELFLAAPAAERAARGRARRRSGSASRPRCARAGTPSSAPTALFVGMSGLRRQRALQGPLPPLRHYAGGRRRGGVHQTVQGMKFCTGNMRFICYQRRQIEHSVRPLERCPGARVGPVTSQEAEDARHGGAGCHQRIRPHRPHCPARHRRSRPQGHRGRRASTISPRSRPTRTCCASTRSTAAFPARSRSTATPSIAAPDRSRSPRSRIRRSCRGRSSASTSRSNAPASSPRRRRPRRISTAGAKRVLVSAPADGADLTVVYGVNHDKLTQAPHRRLQRLLHHQLPRAGRQGAATTPSASRRAS